ncbi:hypothetical protein Mgra_00006786 [Meloidogyne graminicola]|uniref:Phospholipid/glycerol acyltransferase domain-containing protein n=1 Tax=Meloidogyne graminicola TaxID=189291 RepID=A0A8S9ZKV3_9BILA|nr:hypothetical protein Mgra_00006786 [Meloidogyne graminicola]
MTTPHFYDQNKNLNPPNPFEQQQQFDGQATFEYYTQQQQTIDSRQRMDYSNFSATTQMLNQQFMYDPFMNTAKHLGGQFAEQQKQKITQYISTFNLKYYFAVDVNYVRRKLLIILFPFLHRDWTNKLATNDKPMTPREDINAPDLYIPVMAFITYILVAGIVFGVQKRFTPEKLGMLTTNALFYMVFENLVVFLMKYALNISQSLNVWHALAYSSYKFTSMVVCLLLYLIGGRKVYYFVLIYCILATVFFLVMFEALFSLFILAIVIGTALMAFFTINRVVFLFYAKMALFYLSILLAAFFAFFGAVVTYFYNEGCMFALGALNFFCSFWLDIEIEIRGEEKIAKESGPENNPLVLISNHQSNSIFVDRNNKNNAKEALNDAIEKMQKKKLKVWIFPEGTRHHQHGLLPFKKGAFNIAVQAQIPIIPVVISDYTPFYSKPRKYFNSGGKVIVQVLDPVKTQGLKYEDVCQLCDNIQQQMNETYEKISEEVAKIMKRPVERTVNEKIKTG